MIFLLIIYNICPAGCGARGQEWLGKVLDGLAGGCYTPHLYAREAERVLREFARLQRSNREVQVRKRCFMIMQKGFAGDVTTTGRIPPA
jgi:hypothetical protein